MFTFVETDAHPHLKTMTDAYVRLRERHEAAVKASGAERSCAKELNDIPESQRTYPRASAPGGLHSAREDFTDPKWSGRSPKYSQRLQAYASALLNARACYESLYAAAGAMQQLLAQGKENFFQMRDADKSPRWQMEILDHNTVCCHQLFQEALQTLCSFSDRVNVNEHDQVSLLSVTESSEVGAFHTQWMNWFETLPMLPAVTSVDDRREAHLLLQALVDRDMKDRNERSATANDGALVHQHVSEAQRRKVEEMLQERRWTTGYAFELGRWKIGGARGLNKHAPYIRSGSRRWSHR